MKKALLLTIGLFCAAAITLSAAETPKKRELTPEQKQVQKEMLEKYDANKDGRIDRDERAKMTPEDQKKWRDTMGGGQRKKKE